MRLTGRHTGRQLRDVIAPIPRRQSVEPCVHGVVLLDSRRVDEAVHVAIPRFQPHFRSPDRHVVTHFLRQRLERLVVAVFLAILGHARHQVLAQLEVRVQEYLRLHHLERIGRDVPQRLHLVPLHVVLLLRHRIDRAEGLLHQQFVCAQHRVLQRHALGMGHRDAAVQAERCYLHQHRLETVLVGQFEIVPQHHIHDKEPLQPIGALHGSPRHQVVALLGYAHGLRLVMKVGIGIERSRIGVIAHLRVGTHIDRPVESRLQILDLEAELVLVSPPRRLIQIRVELPYSVFSLREIIFLEQQTSTDNLHALARSAEEHHQRLRHLLRLFPDFNGFFIGRQTVHFEHHQTVIALNPSLPFKDAEGLGKADALQGDTSLEIGDDRAVFLSLLEHQMMHFTQSYDIVFTPPFLDEHRYVIQIVARNYFFVFLVLNYGYFHKSNCKSAAKIDKILKINDI